MIKLSEEQQRILSCIKRVFKFEVRNIKLSNTVFENTEDVLQADRLVEKAQNIGDLILDYQKLVDGYTRKLTLTDDAANFLFQQ